MVAIELAYINTRHPDFNKEAAMASCLAKPVGEQEGFTLSRPIVPGAISDQGMTVQMMVEGDLSKVCKNNNNTSSFCPLTPIILFSVSEFTK